MAFITIIFFTCQFNAAASSNLLLSKPRTIANYDGPALAGLAVGISCELDPSFLQLASGYGCWYANLKNFLSIFVSEWKFAGNCLTMAMTVGIWHGIVAFHYSRWNQTGKPSSFNWLKYLGVVSGHFGTQK